MSKPFEQATNKGEQGEKITAEQFKQRSTAIIDDILVTNIKDADFDLKNPKDKEFFDGMVGARNMVGDGYYTEPKFFAGPDGLKQPKFFETPEGILKWNLKNHEDTMAEMKEKHPDDWKDFIPEASLKHMEELKKLLKFIQDDYKEKESRTKKSSETADEKSQDNKKEKTTHPEKETKSKNENSKNEQKKEKLEGEKLFQQQIENNSHSSARGLQGDMIFFIKSVDKGIGKPEDFQYLKEELSELLYRCGVEYAEGKETKIDGKDKEIIQPVLDLRREMDEWDTLSETRIADFRKKLAGYMEDTFGIETQEPREGEKYDSKKMQAMKAEETKNEFLDYKIKKVHAPGYQINEKLFDYYKKWLAEKEQGMKQKWRGMKDSVSREEFDKITDQDQKWLRQHGFTKSIKPAQVEIYKFKA